MSSRTRLYLLQQPKQQQQQQQLTSVFLFYHQPRRKNYLGRLLLQQQQQQQQHNNEKSKTPRRTSSFITRTSQLQQQPHHQQEPEQDFATTSTTPNSSKDEQHSSPITMPELPHHVVKYSQVPGPAEVGKVFTADTIPKGLLKEHSTKEGTWGIIKVLKGELEYVLEQPDSSSNSTTTSEITFQLTSDFHGVIEPKRLHHVRPLSPDVEFVVEFYRVPGTGPVNEQREGLL